LPDNFGMHPFFATLGSSVLERWKASNFSPSAFPQIARLAMEENPPFKHVDVGEFMHGVLLDDQQPLQTQSGFGQPEIIVFEDPRFYIQVLFWLDGTTDIHQHTFSGAFHVLLGSSLHSQFTFKDPESISAHLRVGHVEMRDSQLLETGRTVEITSGAHFIHSLFHLETPSVTVVIRTHNDPGSGPQFTYLPPHLAVDPFHNDSLTNRRKQLLDVLEAIEDPAYPEAVAEMVQALDFERGFFILQNSRVYLEQIECWQEIWQKFAHRHGDLAAFVAPTLEEILRRDALVALRRNVLAVELRFFLALLLNITDRETLLNLVGQRFKGAPAKTVLRWTRELKSELGATDLEFNQLLPANW